MSLAYWCVLMAAVLPYGAVGIAKASSPYDNRDPRKAGLYRGAAYRADAAHKNGLEAFGFFAVAVLVASGGSAHTIIAPLDAMAVAWIVLRLAYTVAYIADRPNARSTVWSAAFVLTVAIFTMPAWRG